MLRAMMIDCLEDAELGGRSETCCTRLAENTGRKNRHLGTITQLFFWFPCSRL